MIGSSTSGQDCAGRASRKEAQADGDLQDTHVLEKISRVSTLLARKSRVEQRVHETAPNDTRIRFAGVSPRAIPFCPECLEIIGKEPYVAVSWQLVKDKMDPPCNHIKQDCNVSQKMGRIAMISHARSDTQKVPLPDFIQMTLTFQLTTPSPPLNATGCGQRCSTARLQKAESTPQTPPIWSVPLATQQGDRTSTTNESLRKVLQHPVSLMRIEASSTEIPSLCISVCLTIMLAMCFLLRDERQITKIRKAADIHMSLMLFKSYRRLRSSYNKIIAKKVERNKAWRLMLITLICYTYLLHVDINASYHPHMLTSLLSVKSGRNRHKNKTRLLQHEKMLIAQLDTYAAHISSTYRHIIHYFKLTSYTTWTADTWIRQVGPVSLTLTALQPFNLRFSESLMMSIVLARLGALLPISRITQDYLQALFDRVQTRKPWLGSHAAKLERLQLQSSFKLASLLIHTRLIWSLGSYKRSKDRTHRDIVRLCNQINRSLSICSNYISAYLLTTLLLRGGDIPPHPEPPSPGMDRLIQPSTDQNENLQKNGDLQMSDKLRILNWNCRGIDSKLHNLPQFLQEHGIHVAILTETQRTISKQKNQTTQQVQGYTFYFSSYIDPTFSSHFLPRQAREWGVCIAIKNGLAFKPVSIHIDAF